MDATHLTPPEVAKRLRVKSSTVISWIRSGELRAIDTARRGARRPRFKIDPADLIAFENGRQVEVKTNGSRRRPKDPDVIEYF